MPSSAQAQQLAAVMDAEREALQGAGIRRVGSLAATVRAATIRAYKSGGDVAAPIRKIVGKAAPVLADAMAAAELQGILRSRINHKQAKRDGLALSDPYRAALKMLADRLSFTDKELRAIAAKHGTAAVSATGEAAGLLERNVLAAVAAGVKANATTNEGISLIRAAFQDSGFDNQSPFVLETVFRTELHRAYSGGQAASDIEPAIADVLWGYEFASVGDDRTTVICLACDGTRAPKDSPFWDSHVPPLHWNCRSQLIQIFDGEQLATPTTLPSIEPAEGFGANPLLVFA